MSQPSVYCRYGSGGGEVYIYRYVPSWLCVDGSKRFHLI